MQLPFGVGRERQCAAPWWEQPGRRLRIALEAVTLGAGLLLALPTASHAYVVSGVAWPGPTISYSIGGGGERTAVKRAPGVWNKANVGIRLQPVPAPLAQVVVGFGYSGPCDGQASMGLTLWPRGWVNIDPR